MALTTHEWPILKPVPLAIAVTISAVMMGTVLSAGFAQEDAAGGSPAISDDWSGSARVAAGSCPDACDWCCNDCVTGPMQRAAGWLIPDLSDAPRKKLADKYGPAAIMGDHVHKKGGFMAEYKLMTMYMEDNKLGTNTVSDQQALVAGQALGTNNGATPTQMTMEMHMLHLMYGLTDEVTVYVMPMWTSLTMDHLRNTPFPPNPPLSDTPFTTHNSGFDDLVMGALWQFHQGPCDRWILNLGFSVPTGELDRRTTAPTGGLVSQELPYPMRRGSGTFDARPGITYKRYFDSGSLGLQFQADIPVGRNDESYRVGEDFRVNAWYSHLLADWLAFSFRLESAWKMNYGGADADLNPAVISTARPDMRGGEWINFGYGANVLLRGNNMLRGEVVHPVYENLDGIQLENDWWFIFSWSKGV